MVILLIGLSLFGFRGEKFLPELLYNPILLENSLFSFLELCLFVPQLGLHLIQILDFLSEFKLQLPEFGLLLVQLLLHIVVGML